MSYQFEPDLRVPVHDAGSYLACGLDALEVAPLTITQHDGRRTLERGGRTPQLAVLRVAVGPLELTTTVWIAAASAALAFPGHYGSLGLDWY